MKHSVIRILTLLIAFALSIPLGFAMLSPDRRCGTGDGLAVMVFMLLFYCIWIVWLFIEAIKFHKKRELKKRNQNFILLITFPVLFAGLYIYVEVLNY